MNKGSMWLIWLFLFDKMLDASFTMFETLGIVQWKPGNVSLMTSLVWFIGAVTAFTIYTKWMGRDQP